MAEIFNSSGQMVNEIMLVYSGIASMWSTELLAVKKLFRECRNGEKVLLITLVSCTPFLVLKGSMGHLA